MLNITHFSCALPVLRWFLKTEVTEWSKRDYVHGTFSPASILREEDFRMSSASHPPRRWTEEEDDVLRHEAESQSIILIH